MSTDTPQLATPQQTAATVGSEVDAFFARVAASGTQQRLRTITGACQYDIAGAGTWRIAVKDGVVTVTKDGAAPSPADCVVSCEAEDFLRIVRHEGRMNMVAAVLQELVTITGDLAFAYDFLNGIEYEPVGARPL